MKVLSFLNDLGIIPNANSAVENDPALRQGQELMDFNRHYNRQIAPNLGLLEESSMPGVGSVIEAMDVQQPKVAAEKSPKDDVSKLEDEYNKTLTDYESTYRLFSESVLKLRKKDKDLSKYFGQAITSSDGNYRYINDFGFTHKYSTDAWAKNASSCPSDALTVDSSILAKLQSGPDMGQGQACGVAGKNIRNNKTGEISWVDIQGYRHVYSTDMWENKEVSCNVPVVEIEDAQYNAIPSGGAMKSTDTCPQLDIDPAIWTKLMKLNDKLLVLSEQLAERLGELVVQDVELQMALEQQQQQLSQSITKIKSDRNNLNNYQASMITTSGELEDSELNQRMRYIQMIAWFFALIAVIALTVRAYLSDESKLMDYVGVIIAIVIVWVVSHAVYKHYMMSGKFL